MFSFRRTAPRPAGEDVFLTIDGAQVRIRLRRDRRARRLTLRLPADGGDPVVTMPVGESVAAARRFVSREQAWLAARLKGRPGVVPFTDGAIVPFRGVDHELVHRGRARGTVSIEADAFPPRLCVVGAPEHMARRLTDWMKRQAKADLLAAVERHAGRLGVAPAAIHVRDTTSRWGSCSSSGTLSFSWRLVLAPPDILDYVAAHEVAHLREMNHSPRFWALVHELTPNADPARLWLRRHGPSLHAYGQSQAG